VSDKGSIYSGIAVRYATAIFELAEEAKILPAVESDLDSLAGALENSTYFGEVISNPVYTRDQMVVAIGAISAKMGLTSEISNTLGLMASKRRLLVLPQMVAKVQEMIAEEKGEVTAEVTAAKHLTKTQQEKLAKILKASMGKDVRVNVAVDESLIGGLIVKVGSKMIDSSIKSKLSNLQNAMKEAG
jgi:F-type H+-transporting ATPase subunit delta